MKYFILLLITFLSNIVQAMTGFAGSMLAMPMFIRLIGMDSARIVLNFIALASSGYIVLKDYKKINIDALKKTTTWLVIGMFLAYIIYSHVNRELLIVLYGVMIIAIALKNLFIKKVITVPDFLTKIILIFAGIAQGLFTSGGPLLVVVLVSMTKDKEEFRATSSTIWVMLCSIFVLQNWFFITTSEIKLTVFLFIPLAVGVILGNLIHKKISQEKFMKMANILVLISGVSVFL
ncbi:sulfite exporter TauE/SafE family protein [Defluviitalea phaphyphila]|uniref:sulfite exporter TauE/SafE family protein n=1 Tax=Defluviitalea phaphyphila TaxID=1473580 RepID=UPI0007316AE4|nr:sulfite exporter TauE/SafE family protein [Defluviitalea phaphyphila]